MSESANEIVACFPDFTEIRYARQEEGEKLDEAGLPIPKRITVVFGFSEAGFGFGEIAIVQTDGHIFIDTEYMKKETVVRLLTKLVACAITDTDQDRDRHKLYSEAMGRECGDQCDVCNAMGR